MNFLALDIETSAIIEDVSQLDKIESLPIACICAVWVEDGVFHRRFFTSPIDRTDLNNGHALQMDCIDVAQAVVWLGLKARDGYTLCAWNGASFDMKWIARNAVYGAARLVPDITRKMIDPMFQFFMLRGFPVSLAAACKGLGIQQEKAMSGADAPKAWREGRQQEVIDYCFGDCELTLLAVDAIQKKGGVSWITQRGMPKFCAFDGLKTVEECMTFPEPDQSWMSTPLKKEKFIGWLLEAGAATA